MQKRKIIIIGSGIAGLSTAVELADAGHEILLFDNSPVIGGRTHSFFDPRFEEHLDNGQHIMMGAYSEFLELTRKIGTYDKLKFIDKIKINLFEPEKKPVKLSSFFLRGSNAMAEALLTSTSISMVSKVNLAKFIKKINKGETDPTGLTAADYLDKNNQKADIFKYFWQPLCLATLNVSPENAPAELLETVLKEAFFAENDKMKFVLPTAGLSELLSPAREYLRERNGKVIISKIEKFEYANPETISAIRTKDGETFKADFFISAVSPETLHSFLSKEDQQYFDFLTKFEYSPIISAYFQYDREIIKDYFSGFIGTNLHWAFNLNKIRDNDDPKQLLGLTISSAKEIASLSQDRLIRLFDSEIRSSVPKAKDAVLIKAKIIKSMRATPLFTPSNLKNRPAPGHLFGNLFFAGDWSSTGLPATIESAAKSGKMAAEEIITGKYLERKEKIDSLAKSLFGTLIKKNLGNKNEKNN